MRQSHECGMGYPWCRRGKVSCQGKRVHTILYKSVMNVLFQRKIFLEFPGTRLGKVMASSNVDQILKLCDEFTPSSPPQYFFDHNPETFAGFDIDKQAKVQIIVPRPKPSPDKSNPYCWARIPNLDINGF